MPHSISNLTYFNVARVLRIAACTLFLFCAARCGAAQDTPLLSGGIGFFTNTPGGNTTYVPIVEPLLAAPLGQHLLIESRGAFDVSFAPKGNGEPGYTHSHFIGLSYLEGDYFLSSHVTVSGGSFLLPFGTYNERLSPFWIGNFQNAPLVYGLGQQSTGIGVGGMLRGSAIARRRYSIDYAAWFSTHSGFTQFSAQRSSGGRVSLYLPEKRLEIGASYDRSLQGTQENFEGMHLWWEPANTGFRFRSEYAHGQHAHGYWFEADYRMQRFGGMDSWIGRFEPVFRMNQVFRLDTTVSDGVPIANTQRVDFGFDYNLPHNTRILTSYARQFSPSGDENIWETGIAYRFLFPVWKGR